MLEAATNAHTSGRQGIQKQRKESRKAIMTGPSQRDGPFESDRIAPQVHDHAVAAPSKAMPASAPAPAAHSINPLPAPLLSCAPATTHGSAAQCKIHAPHTSPPTARTPLSPLFPPPSAVLDTVAPTAATPEARIVEWVCLRLQHVQMALPPNEQLLEDLMGFAQPVTPQPQVRAVRRKLLRVHVRTLQPL